LIITKDVVALKFHRITRETDKRVTDKRQASLLGILPIRLGSIITGWADLRSEWSFSKVSSDSGMSQKDEPKLLITDGEMHGWQDS